MILDLLGSYENVSGQKINKSKTTLFFSKSTLDETKEIIRGLLGVQEIQHYEKHLGLPSLVGKGKKANFNYIKEKVWKKLQGWEGRLLSQAGREVLIKSVIQAIPSFAMGCFKISIGLCNDIEVMIRKFWCGERGNRRKIHWLKWDEMTKSKWRVEWGFEMAMYNDSLLAKQAWRLLTDKDSLFYKIFKAIFFPHCTIMEVKDSRSSSYAWKSILHGRDVILRGAKWRIGNGKTIQIYKHNWLPQKNHDMIMSPTVESMEGATVDVLVDPETRQWNNTMVDGLFTLSGS